MKRERQKGVKVAFFLKPFVPLLLRFLVPSGQYERRRAARCRRHLPAGYDLASSPVALRPPHPWPRACHGGVASSL
ncbi:MAG: hypothetical protein MUC98_16930, partial [Desulfobacterota bacterium]|nr:hypothetical protein [Thermodesulfobacteriota bacterium]